MVVFHVAFGYAVIPEFAVDAVAVVYGFVAYLACEVYAPFDVGALAV
jgi:hypothetical protein